MQILPLVTARDASSVNGGSLDAALTSRKSAMFASLLDNARASAATNSGTSVTDTASAGSLAATTSEAGAAQSETRATGQDAVSAHSDDDLMNLRMTREDLAALRDDLKNQGFSDDELAAMETKVDSESGMTWGEMMQTVEKKISKTEKSSKKEISNDDTVQLLGLFGKLGFTAEQSQKMIDSLAAGDTQSVLSAIDAKVAEHGADTSVSLGSDEMKALGRAMNLSDEAQSRLAALFDNSSASSGLSGQGLTTAFGLVKNELLAQLHQENQAMAEFRQSAAKVMDQAWLRESGKLNAGLHNDDVARKAAQAVAMGEAVGAKKSETPTAATQGVDVLADVPKQGQGVASKAAASSESGTTTELHGRAGAVAAEQAGLAGQGENAAQAGQTADAGQVRQDAGGKTAGQATQLASDQNAAGQNAGQNAGQSGQQGGAAGGFSHQTGQEGAWAELAGKIRMEKGAGTAAGGTATGANGQTAATMAAMDAVNAQTAGKTTGKAFDAAMAARVARQVETGILRNVGQDAKQLTLELTPEDLGKLSVTLTVKDKEVRAVIAADKADTAAMLNEQAAKIKQTLEDQGFKVTKLEVQTGIAKDNQNAWQSPEQHNMAREQRESAERMRSGQRLLQGGVSDFTGDGDGFVPPTTAGRAQGLDLFA
ncbi:flagellar hook-length control protein FliK [Solidesulfovibrio alcoholivorans]|uniref:flagellar hook-length control protein FliK n=1 Tax=Solidesulfovibrio alcoholivorans TaxID=81406 RepID=UPI00049841EC|nr:flagellar hook-length control protein FliK [Solidesulfovibrio alcoholivorans]